jgi:uncharacterized coiled-coil protein SlyX
MWILKFLPSWLFYLTLLAGSAAFLVAYFVRTLPQVKLIQVASAAVVAFSIYMIGAISNNDAWLARVKELEAKVAQAEAQSAEINTQLAEKTLVKTQVVKQRGQDIIKYVDREVVKFDANCAIPKEFVVVHNRSAEAPKK